ncbi:MAG: nickel pincer cofactor biosynthesis protein LarC [Phycisphaerales bacterium]|nr:MAG: nickel pincer cofactor biosynthesis protein LarC [Phycisphaerales bacterium]
MRIAYFDCFSGAGGDMIVAALVHAGADAEALRERLAALGLSGYALTIEPINKQGFAATRFNVALDESHKQPHRHLTHIEEILQGGALPQHVAEQAAAIFRRLAEAEAAVHGTTVDRVHFHEVGAVDAIMDVVGAVAALDLLGIERIVCSSMVVGSGTVTCAHGVMPVPAPATAELIKGLPVAATAEKGELLTPTAAAILTTLADDFGPMPAMRVGSIGYGAGIREGEKVPNLLRVFVGESEAPTEIDRITVLETNLDDATPEQIGYCIERLFEEGALDAYTVPINMKKSRPGVVLTVLCEDRTAEALQRTIFAETPTLGIRRYQVHRAKLARRHETVETPYGSIRMKIAEGLGARTANPEYEDCRRAAAEHGAALRDVMAVAQAAWRAKEGS